MEQIRLETHGALRWYTKFLILNGPLYMLLLGSLMLWVQLVQSPTCAELSQNLYFRLKIYASCGFTFSLFFHALVQWHERIIHTALCRHKKDLRKAPPGTLSKLTTVPYVEALFGDENGKRYPAECPICLEAWEREDVIKVTPCDHAFHEECLGDWLKLERSCALCRQDVSKPIAQQNTRNDLAQVDPAELFVERISNPPSDVP